MVTGEYDVTEVEGQKVNMLLITIVRNRSMTIPVVEPSLTNHLLTVQVDMMVTDTTGHHLVNREGLEKTGKFAFTTDKCVTLRVTSVTSD